MPDPLTRAEPVPSTPYVTAGVTISLAPPMARYSMRARRAQTLETLLGVNVPKKIGTTEAGMACLGPDEWLMRAAAGTTIAMGSGLAVAITDISERSVCLVVDGPRAAEIIMTGCPLDLDHFAVARATRTIFETVEITLIREDRDRFHVEVWRSFGPWLWEALTTASSN